MPNPHGAPGLAKSRKGPRELLLQATLGLLLSFDSLCLARGGVPDMYVLRPILIPYVSIRLRQFYRLSERRYQVICKVHVSSLLLPSLPSVPVEGADSGVKVGIRARKTQSCIILLPERPPGLRDLFPSWIITSIDCVCAPHLVYLTSRDSSESASFYPCGLPALRTSQEVSSRVRYRY